MLDNHEMEEQTILSMIIYSENMSKDIVYNIFRNIPDGMLVGNMARKVYKILKERCACEDIEIIGTTQFAEKIVQIAEIEYKLGNYVIELQNNWASAYTASYWIKRIQQRFFNQQYAEAKTKEDFEKVVELENKYSLKDETETLGSDEDTALDEYDKRQQSAIFTSYRAINKVIGSLQGGDMIVMAGASSSGKTCMMLNLIMGMAKAGKKVLVFSLEMPKYQLEQRLIAAEANIDSRKFRSFQLSELERSRYKQCASNVLRKLPIEIYKHQNVSMETIKNIIAKSKPDIVFIDYLGLVNSYSNKSSYEKYSDISREIKLTAGIFNVPIVALHQLNRSFNDRDDKTPKVSDLRDSGKIEQDADMIWLIYRPIQFDENQAPDDMRFIVGKNRAGESNKEIRLTFNGINQRVTEPIGI